MKGEVTALSRIKRLIRNLFVENENISIDPQSVAFFPNHVSRPVNSGHYVLTKPESLTSPFLISYNRKLFREFGIEKKIISEDPDSFCKFFSGDAESIQKVGATPWATPYAVSVRGHPILVPDQFGGRGYGDGRASYLCQLGDYEVQLKGSGRTPFSRGNDGRAVLRSSIREYLASLFMYTNRVATTRPVCLVSSIAEEDKVLRPWYDPETTAGSQYEYPPNQMRYEKLAIASRATKTFMRIGHLEVFARRARESDEAVAKLAKTQLKGLVDHFCSIYDIVTENGYLDFVKFVGETLSTTVNEWLRVGYVQGNMNSDNMLLNGDTLDYGPFGFMERYSATFNPFTSDPQKQFGFENQPRAMYINMATFVDALSVLIEDKEEIKKVEQYIKQEFPRILNNKRSDMFMKKLGISGKSINQEHIATAQLLHDNLYKLLPTFDYTMFFDILTESASEGASNVVIKLKEAAYDEEGFAEVESKLLEWIGMWKEVAGSSPDVACMGEANPTFVPREWLLVKAYEDAINSSLFRTEVKEPVDILAKSANMSIIDLWHDNENLNAARGFGKFYALEKLFANDFNDTEVDVLKGIFCQKTPEMYRDKPGTSFFS